MPIYEYQCSNCDHRLEALQKMSDAPLTECPSCHQKALRKLVSAAGFRLKGGGWYETDFKQHGRKQLAESDSRASDSSTKTDNKSSKADGATSNSAGDTGKKAANKQNDKSSKGPSTSKPASKAAD
ncbi:MAG: FmdB family zinc ribbon protein [Pseudohongiellaceae bacterium]|jgi:putative FmdB family regulatory protein